MPAEILKFDVSALTILKGRRREEAKIGDSRLRIVFPAMDFVYKYIMRNDAVSVFDKDALSWDVPISNINSFPSH
jgi:hypothetical protein